MDIDEALTTAYRRVCPPFIGHADTLAPQRLCAALLHVLPVDGATLSVFDSTGLPMLIGASCPDTDHFARLEFTCGQGPTLDAHLDRQVISASQQESSVWWPLLTDQANAVTPFRSVVALPLPGAIPATATLFARAQDPPRLPTTDLDAIGRRITTTLLDTVPREPVTQKPTGPPPWLDSPTVQIWKEVMVAAGVISAITLLAVDDALAVLRASAWTAHRTADQLAADVLHHAGSLNRAADLACDQLLALSDADPGNEDPAQTGPGSSAHRDGFNSPAESTWPTTTPNNSWSMMIATLSPSDKSELDAAQLHADRAAHDQDQAMKRARAVQFRAGTHEMVQLAAAERSHQRARQRLTAIWARHHP